MMLPYLDHSQTTKDVLFEGLERIRDVLPAGHACREIVEQCLRHLRQGEVGAACAWLLDQEHSWLAVARELASETIQGRRGGTVYCDLLEAILVFKELASVCRSHFHKYERATG